ncbi:LytTR family DNA-binding domain-containing protein [Glaciecola siphonariae]|uniref:LytTR family DNA-binding domain-containing protein n=1 Tax=Glaciecola siphonariae TaxID=521012 RepID=A0ABV9LV43_9ALTE
MFFSKIHFQQHKTVYEASALCCYFAVDATVNATTVLMEDARQLTPSFESWEPFVWEYSSAFSSFLIIPFIAWFMRQYKWDWHSFKVSLLRYILAAIVYSVLHVSLMVSMREFAYSFTSSNYDFAHSIQALFFELFYELRKDLWSFCFFVAMIAIYRFLTSQWLGDASPLTEQANTNASANNTETLASLLLVKKLGKEFIVKSKYIEWVEACGNYANLHVQSQLYPMRITLSDLVDKGSALGLVRTHKSFAVNINYVDSIETLSSGDAEIIMHSGKKIRLSRRYKEGFESSIVNI